MGNRTGGWNHHYTINMKKQIVNDGNKRAAVIFANHYLIAKAGGLLVIPEVNVPEFKKLLVQYYEDKDNGELKEFLKRNCHKAYVAP